LIQKREYCAGVLKQWMELSNEEKEREFTCGLQKCKGGEGTEIDQDYKELDLHMLTCCEEITKFMLDQICKVFKTGIFYSYILY